MSAIRIQRPKAEKSAVIPVESPTVPKAESASNSVAPRSKGLVAMSVRVQMTTAFIAMNATAKACRCASGGTRRPKALTVGSPRSSAQTMSASTAKVVTLMPPPVAALPVPTNMSMSVTRSDSVSISP